MISSRELMVGNYAIHNFKHGVTGIISPQIAQIRDLQWHNYPIGLIDEDGYAYEGDLNDIFPIWLNNFILLRFGIRTYENRHYFDTTPDDYNYYLKYQEPIAGRKFDLGGYILYRNSERITEKPINTLHRLQNLYFNIFEINLAVKGNDLNFMLPKINNYD